MKHRINQISTNSYTLYGLSPEQKENTFKPRTYVSRTPTYHHQSISFKESRNEEERQAMLPESTQLRSGYIGGTNCGARLLSSQRVRVYSDRNLRNSKSYLLDSPGSQRAARKENLEEISREKPSLFKTQNENPKIISKASSLPLELKPIQIVPLKKNYKEENLENVLLKVESCSIKTMSLCGTNSTKINSERSFNSDSKLLKDQNGKVDRLTKKITDYIFFDEKEPENELFLGSELGEFVKDPSMLLSSFNNQIESQKYLLRNKLKNCLSKVKNCFETIQESAELRLDEYALTFNRLVHTLAKDSEDSLKQSLELIMESKSVFLFDASKFLSYN